MNKRARKHRTNAVAEETAKLVAWLKEERVLAREWANNFDIDGYSKPFFAAHAVVVLADLVIDGHEAGAKSVEEYEKLHRSASSKLMRAWDAFPQKFVRGDLIDVVRLCDRIVHGEK